MSKTHSYSEDRLPSILKATVGGDEIITGLCISYVVNRCCLENVLPQKTFFLIISKSINYFKKLFLIIGGWNLLLFGYAVRTLIQIMVKTDCIKVQLNLGPCVDNPRAN